MSVFQLFSSSVLGVRVPSPPYISENNVVGTLWICWGRHVSSPFGRVSPPPLNPWDHSLLRHHHHKRRAKTAFFYCIA